MVGREWPGGELELDRQGERRRAERLPRRLRDASGEQVVAGAAHDRPDAEGKRLADHRGAADRGEPVHERLLQAVEQRSHGVAGHGGGEHLAPVVASRAAAADRLHGDLAHEVGALVAEHECEHQRAGALAIGHRDAVHLGDRVREQGCRLDEAEGLGAREAEGDAGADRGDHGGGAHSRSARGDGRDVARLEHVDDLLGGGVRVLPADAAEVGEHRRALHREQPVERALDDRPWRAGRTAARLDDASDRAFASCRSGHAGMVEHVAARSAHAHAASEQGLPRRRSSRPEYAPAPCRSTA